MNDYPKFIPLPLRPEAQPGYQKTAWKPTWDCFCCHDTGLVRVSLIEKVIPDYIPSRHKPVECNATNCKIRLSELLYTTQTLDERFTNDICDLLDREERKIWFEWSKQRHEMRKHRLGLADIPDITHNLRARNRTSDEQLDVECRHQNVIEQ